MFVKFDGKMQTSFYSTFDTSIWNILAILMFL